MKKKLAEMDWMEQDELAKLLSPWLDYYTEEVIKRVIDQLDDILANETAMMMIRELGEREEKEKDEFRSDLRYILQKKAEKDEDGYQKRLDTLRNYCLEHSKSYRDVLYDMYIRTK